MVRIMSILSEVTEGEMKSKLIDSFFRRDPSLQSSSIFNHLIKYCPCVNMLIALGNVLGYL